MARNDVFKGFLGCTAVAAWLFLFAAGLLIDSKTYRNRISRQPSVAIAAETTGSEANGGAKPVSGSVLLSDGNIDWRAFGVTMLVYTPLNAALLVMLAGLIGGCASNLTYSTESAATAPPANVSAKEGRQERNPFLTENPFASMLRSFLVFVGFIAGIYITANAPFDAPTADQYVRFVGTLSLLAFVVGYDPTKFQDFLNLVPRPGGGK